MSGASLFVRLIFRTFFKNVGTHGRMTPKRLLLMLGFFAVIPLHQLTIWICFFLDELLFPDYRKQRIDNPVFIVGNFRSGSTLLYRLMDQDEDFTAFRTWEIYVAPTITQRKLWYAVAALDRRLGGYGRRLLGWIDRVFFGHGIHHMHKFGFLLPEEDEGLMFHIWSSLFIIFPFPFPDEFLPYDRFDTDVPVAERRRVMSYYRLMVQRHVYFHGGKRFISKNPAFTGKIASLYEAFPDARLVYLARAPHETLASQLSFLGYLWGYMNDPLEAYPFKAEVNRWTHHWYRYPLEVFRRAPHDQYIVLRYDDLTGALEPTVRRVYDRFGFDLNPAFAITLAARAAQSRGYRSTHRYTLRDIGLDPTAVYSEYRDIYERFDFAAPEGADTRQPVETPTND